MATDRHSMLTVLAKLGYRKMNNRLWGKPVGYQLFTVEVAAPKLRWTNHFKGADDKMHVWNSDEFETEDELKSLEASTKMVLNCVGTDFGFLTPTQQFNELL